MKIAFYAPLKSPDHPVPSGDRQIARSLLRALNHAGHDTLIASHLRSFDAHGDAQRQARLRRIGARIAARLVRRWREAPPPDVWLTYHVYHKAPDVIGPLVSRALCIPYVAVEASITLRERDGPWSSGHALAVDAIRGADTIICVNPRDLPEVRRARASSAPVDVLAPFVDAAAFTAGLDTVRSSARDDCSVRLIAVAMMRDGAKLASYRALAAALAQLPDVRWSLRIVGDGPARRDVEDAFGPVRDRVSFVGERAGPAIAALLRDSDVLVWPAIGEAIGLVFVEAQACGLPVIGGDSPGVAAVVDAGRTGVLVPREDPPAFAAAIRRLANDPSLRQRMGAAAAAHVRARHDVPVAAAALDAILRRVVQARHPLEATRTS